VRTDSELLDAWRGGDRPAGNELFDRYFEAVRRFFANKADRDTEDLVQRTFLAVVEGRERFEGRSTFRTYLFAVANNVLREFIRAKRNDRKFDFGTHSVMDLGAGPSSVLVEKQQQRLLLEALRRIPLDFQTVLELYFWERFTGVQLAEVLGVPENTARSRVRRGKELLVEALRELEGDGAVAADTVEGLDAWAASLRERVRMPTA
jgi:RNA polymerase sigma factor (sigma-70 family)